MIDGSAADQRHTSAVLPIVSLACAAGVVFCLLLVFRYIGDGTSGGAASGFGMLLVLVGITTGLLGRDHGRRTGSPLSLIAVIANGVLLGIFGLLIVIGLTKHR